MAALTCKLNARQAEALKQRFGAALDLRKEFQNARAYALYVHTGRPYKNFGRFFWNWCLRAEQMRRGKQPERKAAPLPRHQAPAERQWTDEELQALLTDELEELREFARVELERRKNASAEGPRGA